MVIGTLINEHIVISWCNCLPEHTIEEKWGMEMSGLDGLDCKLIIALRSRDMALIEF